jgi:hypothetical protein
MLLDMPSLLCDSYTIKVFNTICCHRICQCLAENQIHREPFFHMLDSIGDWNRTYGRNGFTQFRFVLPKEAGYGAMRSILKRIVDSAKGSCFAVL